MSDTCERCQRPILYPIYQDNGRYGHVVKSLVRHAYYGCDTGCCGHEVIGLGCNGKEVFSKFNFDHPRAEGREKRETWARSLADYHLRGVPLDFEACEISDD